MDQIIIQDLELFCRAGVTDKERAHPQRLLLTIEMDHDVTPAAAHDDLSATIDYDTVAHAVSSLAQSREWRLIETLAVETANLILAQFAARSVRVEVKKFVLPQTKHVAVRVHRPPPA